MVVIHQPDFLPWLGFFHRLLYANLWVVLDDVQYVDGTSKSWQNRDKIKTVNGEKWITVSVKKHGSKAKINEIFLASDETWRVRNLNLIKENYRSAPYYQEILPVIEELYTYRAEKLIDFSLKSIDTLCALFDISVQRIFSSDLGVEGKGNELLTRILKKTGRNVYLSGVGARDYFDPEVFNKANIEVVWQNFRHPVYGQQHGNFVPYLSSIDLLFNCGIKESRKILRGC